MKTVLTFVLMMIVIITINAQILLNESFDSYQTGVIIGQNGYTHSTVGNQPGIFEEAYQVVESIYLDRLILIILETRCFYIQND